MSAKNSISVWKVLCFVCLLFVLIAAPSTANIVNASWPYYYGSFNNTILDGSLNNFTVTPYGNWNYNNTAGYSAFGGSVYTNTSGYFTAGSPSDWGFLHDGITPWTITTKIRGFTASSNRFVFADSIGGFTPAAAFSIRSGNYGRFYITNNTAVVTDVSTSTNVYPTSGIYDLTIMFNGTHYTGYVNTTNVFTVAKASSGYSPNTTSPSYTIYIGARANPTDYLNSYLEDFVIIKGSAISPVTVSDRKFSDNPHASFTQDVLRGTIPYYVAVTNTSLGNIDLSTHEWYLDNVHVSSGANANILIDTPGIHTITLKITNPFGVALSNSTVTAYSGVVEDYSSSTAVSLISGLLGGMIGSLIIARRTQIAGVEK